VIAGLQQFREPGASPGLERIAMPVGNPPFTVLAIVWALASPDVGRMLCDIQGWTTGEYADWLEETLVATLLTAE
jgi:hypothetical protein